MSDFPKGGDIISTRAWLDKKGFVGHFVGWEADALLGADKHYVISKVGKDEGERLCGLLNTARKREDRLQLHMSDFLWSGSRLLNQSKNSTDFRFDGFGKYILSRKGIVRSVIKAAEKQLREAPLNSTGIYLSGCRGMGKTCDLKLIARELFSAGWEVYWFPDARTIPDRAGSVFKEYVENNADTKIAVIIDEVGSDPNADIFNALLKDAPPNVMTIGAAVPRYLPTGGTARFRTVFHSSELTLQENDEDVHELIEYWKSKENASSEMVDYICKFLLSYCGGHVYPVLALMEHLFTNDEAKGALTDITKFHRYMNSPEFRQSVVFRNIISRCFDEISNPQTAETLARVLSGKEKSGDIDVLSRVGYWDEDRKDIISSLFLNAFTDKVLLIDQDKEKESVLLDGNQLHQKNLELIITEGLKGMEPYELDLPSNSLGWPIENALSFNLARSIKAKFSNIYLQFQKPFGGKWMDFYVNGFVDAGLEIMRNATRTNEVGAKAGSQDIDEHLQRFVSGQYAETNFAILNFAMKGKVVLPRDAAHHEKVYTYNHLNNSLYRGNVCITSTAVKSLMSRTPPIRNYSTSIQREKPAFTSLVVLRRLVRYKYIF